MTPWVSDVLILGGGAAGLFCAFNAANRGLSVHVLERADRVGKKILMSGGGRCNFTNTGTTAAQFLSANPHFCKSALARFSPDHFIALVNRHGIAWHEKELGQLFCDDSSKQIVQMLMDECQSAGVRISTRTETRQVAHRDGWFEVQTALGTLRAPRLVVATGGLSIPSLGGSGFGYELARQFGHPVRPLRAGLVPLTLSGRPLEDWQSLSGLSLPVEASCEGAAFSNAMLITHRGLSGPALLQISSYWQAGEPLRIDLMPHADASEFLVEQQRAHPGIELRSALSEILPKRFAQRFCELLAPRRPLRQFRAPELREVAARLHDWPVVPNGTEGYRTAEVTLGGVDTHELSSTTMASRRVPNLYFIGEVVDVTGWLGGYNFQWAWASAHACAQSL
ncbi:MAG: NAD(P)/FAD-dependent oxidoreductase [Panacagrimonas sp.]